MIADDQQQDLRERESDPNARLKSPIVNTGETCKIPKRLCQKKNFKVKAKRVR